MEPREIPPVALLGLRAFGGIEHSGQFRAVQDLQLGDLRRMQAPRVGNRRFLFVGRRLLRDTALRIFLTQTLHGKFHRALRPVVAHPMSVNDQLRNLTHCRVCRYKYRPDVLLPSPPARDLDRMLSMLVYLAGGRQVRISPAHVSRCFSW